MCHFLIFSVFPHAGPWSDMWKRNGEMNIRFRCQDTPLSTWHIFWLPCLQRMLTWEAVGDGPNAGVSAIHMGNWHCIACCCVLHGPAPRIVSCREMNQMTEHLPLCLYICFSFLPSLPPSPFSASIQIK